MVSALVSSGLYGFVSITQKVPRRTGAASPVFGLAQQRISLSSTCWFAFKYPQNLPPNFMTETRVDRPRWNDIHLVLYPQRSTK
jgi:hypothetical protein